MRNNMRVAMYYSNKDVRIEEQPVPQISEGELLVRVYASGLCGSDVLEWYRINKVPLVLGHEIAGEVTAAGGGVKGFKTGGRVAASHHVPCGSCHYCKSAHETVCETLRKTNFYPGGLSEYVRLPAINVEKGTYPLPEGVSYEEATFIEPLACALRGQRLAGMKKDKSVLIIGSGISGLLHIQLARLRGASRVIATDIIGYRLGKAKEFGADEVISAKDNVPERVRKINNDKLPDLVILCAGADSAILQGLKSVSRGGTVLFFAAAGEDSMIPLTVNEIFWRNEVTLMSSYAGSPKDHREALALIKERKVNVASMITHRLALSETARGFRLVADAGESIKVIIEPQR